LSGFGFVCYIVLGVVATVVAQANEGLYQDRYSIVVFPLAIEAFGCLHQQVDNFFHHCINNGMGYEGL